MCINPMSSWIKPLYDRAYHTKDRDTSPESAGEHRNILR